MDTPIALIPTPAALILRPVVEQAKQYAAASKAESTKRAYQSDWRAFSEWCSKHALCPLPAPPDVVACYLTALADERKTSTIQRRVSAISQAHQLAGFETPTKAAAVRAVLRGIRRVKGTAQRGKAPVLAADLRAMVECLPDTLLGMRDRALLLLGFSGAFRRSELVALDVEDLAFTSDGMVVTIRRSKTDQEGEGRQLGIPFGSTPATCPVRSVQRWLETSGITTGPVFHSVNRHGQISLSRLTDQVVARVVRRVAAVAGMETTNLAGHSLRAGLATSAAMNGVSERVIAQQTGHRSMAVLRKYIRTAELFRENASARLL